MSRYTGPTTKINRRFGMALFPENKDNTARIFAGASPTIRWASMKSRSCASCSA